MRGNKQFIIERPFLVVAGMAGVFASASPGNATLAAIVALSILLCANFSLTVNRMRSSARISGYIAAVLEPGICWVGWENALREYLISRVPLEKNKNNIANDVVAHYRVKNGTLAG